MLTGMKPRTPSCAAPSAPSATAFDSMGMATTRAESAPTDEASATRSHGTSTGMSSEVKRILLAEDNANDLELTLAALRANRLANETPPQLVAEAT